MTSAETLTALAQLFQETAAIVRQLIATKAEDATAIASLKSELDAATANIQDLTANDNSVKAIGESLLAEIESLKNEAAAAAPVTPVPTV
jgi:peptidoglycan hydrolase CwlO-like protein